jgi:uncharacterized protein YegJ (DUF2314 family)
MKKRSNLLGRWMAAWVSVGYLLCGGICVAEDKPKAAPSREQSQEAEEEESEEMSYVLFLSKTRTLTREGIIKTLQKAWDLDAERLAKFTVTADPELEGDWIVRSKNMTLHLQCLPEPWLEDQATIIEDSDDLRMRAMLRNVTAHLSIRLERNFVSTRQEEIARELAARLMGSFVDAKDTLAIFDDETGDFNYISDEVVAALAGAEPQEAFEIEVAPPVIAVDGKSPAYQSAVAEAKRRWPEFSKEFRDHGTERGPFMVKCGFINSENRSEFMWCEVVSIHGMKLVGVLKNEPLDQPNLNKGDQLTLSLTTMVDWLYPDVDGNNIGGFTLDVVKQAQRETKP